MKNMAYRVICNDDNIKVISRRIVLTFNTNVQKMLFIRYWRLVNVRTAISSANIKRKFQRNSALGLKKQLLFLFEVNLYKSKHWIFSLKLFCRTNVIEIISLRYKIILWFYLFTYTLLIGAAVWFCKYHPNRILKVH